MQIIMNCFQFLKKTYQIEIILLLFPEFRNLCHYCDRMKREFWTDWDECNTAGGTKKATH